MPDTPFIDVKTTGLVTGRKTEFFGVWDFR